MTGSASAGQAAYAPQRSISRPAPATPIPGPRPPQKGDGPNAVFGVLEKRLAAMGEPDFGIMTAGEFILYQSQLSPGGSKYTKLQRFPLGLLSNR